MNYVDRRKGPKLEFVIPDHRLEFENHILDIYEINEDGFWGCVPSLEKGIAEYIRPKHIFAGLMGKVHGNPLWYTQQTDGKMIPEFHDIWSTQNLMKISEEGYVADVQESYVNAARDAMKVLDFHRMFYAFGVADGPGNGMVAFRNIPCISVW
jgi:hypothetical protein